MIPEFLDFCMLSIFKFFQTIYLRMMTFCANSFKNDFWIQKKFKDQLSTCLPVWTWRRKNFNTMRMRTLKVSGQVWKNYTLNSTCINNDVQFCSWNSARRFTSQCYHSDFSPGSRNNLPLIHCRNYLYSYVSRFQHRLPWQKVRTKDRLFVA